jgi:hypothetical protein
MNDSVYPTEYPMACLGAYPLGSISFMTASLSARSSSFPPDVMTAILQPMALQRS